MACQFPRLQAPAPAILSAKLPRDFLASIRVLQIPRAGRIRAIAPLSRKAAPRVICRVPPASRPASYTPSHPSLERPDWPDQSPRKESKLERRLLRLTDPYLGLLAARCVLGGVRQRSCPVEL